MKHLILSLLIFFLSAHFSLQACTGLSLQAKDGAYIQARTIEWGESDLPSEYVIIPRGRQIKTYTPDRTQRSYLPNEIRHGRTAPSYKKNS